jgi:hypothetical protein
MNGDQTLTLADAEARVATLKVNQFQHLTTGLDHEERSDDRTTPNALPPRQQLSGRIRSQRARVSSVLESSMICAVVAQHSANALRPECNPPFTARNDRLLESRVRLCQKGGQS